MKNEYEIRGEVTVIFLTRRDKSIIETLISTEDLPKVQSFPYRWYATWSKTGNSFYVQAHDYRKPTANSRCSTIKLHRLLMDSPKDKCVDHYNNTTLDNRRENLRVIDKTENAHNVRAYKNSKSGIRGVYWDKSIKYWVASMQLNGKLQHIGIYNCKEEAEKEVIKARAKYMKGSKEYAEIADKDSLDVKFGIGDGPTKSNRSGVRGVGYNKRLKKWRARVQHENKKIHVGSYDTLKEAENAIKEYRSKLKSS